MATFSVWHKAENRRLKLKFDTMVQAEIHVAHSANPHLYEAREDEPAAHDETAQAGQPSAVGADDELPMHEWEAKGREYEKAIQVIRDHIDTNQSIAPVVHAINYLQKELFSLLSTDMVRDETYNDIWDIVRPDPETWDYQSQITRHVRYQAEELAALRKRVADVEGERDAERQRGDNNHTLLMNAVKRNIDLKGQVDAAWKMSAAWKFAAKLRQEFLSYWEALEGEQP